MDSKTAALVGDMEKSNASDDELFADLEDELDNEFDMSGLRERRMQQLQEEYAMETSNQSQTLSLNPERDASRKCVKKTTGNLQR